MRGQPRVLCLFRLAVAALAGAVSLLGILSWFGAVHWTLELLSHFPFYYFLLGVALAVAAFASRLPVPAAIVAVVGVANGVAAWPHMSLPRTLVHPTPSPVVRILWANLRNWSTDLAALRRLVAQEEPDIAVFTGLAGSQAGTFRDMRPLLPFQTPMLRGNPLEVMLLAKQPPEALQVDRTVREDAPLLSARLCPAGSPCFTLIALHAARPLPYNQGARDRHLAHAASVARRHVDRSERVILVGDLNLTPFSPVFGRLLAQSGLTDTASMPMEVARAPSFTWWLGNSGIGLPIDHALVGPQVLLVGRRLGQPIRSDHLPLIVEVRILP